MMYVALFFIYFSIVPVILFYPSIFLLLVLFIVFIMIIIDIITYISKKIKNIIHNINF